MDKSHKTQDEYHSKTIGPINNGQITQNTGRISFFVFLFFSFCYCVVYFSSIYGFRYLLTLAHFTKLIQSTYNYLQSNYNYCIFLFLRYSNIGRHPVWIHVRFIFPTELTKYLDIKTDYRPITVVRLVKTSSCQAVKDDLSFIA